MRKHDPPRALALIDTITKNPLFIVNSSFVGVHDEIVTT